MLRLGDARRIRRAYELSQLVVAAGALGLAIAVTTLALWIHGTSDIRWSVVIALMVVAPFLVWCGDGWRRGAYAGLLAGLPPLFAPAIMLALSPHHCSACDVAAWPCVAACFGTSSLVGIIVGLRAAHDRSPRSYGIAALSTATLTGLLGCGLSGSGGALGIAAGMVAGGSIAWCSSVTAPVTADCGRRSRGS